MAAVTRADILFRSGGSEVLRTGVPWLRGSRTDGREVEKYTHTRADAATCASTVDRDGIIKYAAANKLRLAWDYGRGTPGLTLEPSRTNKVRRSEDFSASTVWTVARASISTNAATAPDGASTADKLVEDATVSNSHYLFATVTISAGVALAYSVFAKTAGESRGLRMFVQNAAGTSVASYSFNVDTGTVTVVAALGSAVAVMATIVAYANGWYRCAIVGTVGATTTSARVLAALESGGTYVYTGDGASGVYLWGAQAEAGVYPSSYIPTTTASVTRAADALTFPIGFGPQDLTVYAKIARPPWADVSGTLGVSPAVLSLGGDDATYGAVLYGESATRTWVALLGGQTATAAVPAGDPLELCAQYRFATDGKCRLDVGSGFGSLSLAGNTAFTTQVLRVGCLVATLNELGGAVERLLVARGSFTLAECQAVQW